MTKKKKTTMSVSEMQRLLGLGKTDAYWLVKKQCFETIVVSGKMRVVIDSFEHWYARQVKHKKVHGPPPGKVLRAESYSPQELAEELGVSVNTVYDMIQRYHIETFEVDSWMRISKDVFKKWYKAQHKYRTRADRARDAALEAQTMTMPEVAQILGIPRKAVYHILLYGPDRDKFDFVFIAGRRRVTKESFERWYADQSRFCTEIDRTKSVFSMQEVAILLSITYREVREMIHNGELSAQKCGAKYWIPGMKSSGFYSRGKTNKNFKEVKIMALIVHRNDRFIVVHYEYDNMSGKNKQKWETYRTLADAKRRKAEIERRQELGALDVPTCKTVNDLLKEYISLYGKATWSLSVFSSNSRLIKNYISPIIGKMDLCEISPRILEKYYQQLLKTPAVSHVAQKRGTKNTGFVQPPTVRKVHSLLRSAFNQAVKWELLEKNPALYATVPKAVSKKREVWDSETIFLALDVCDDDRLKLAINLSFACSMRIGEILGLTWDCVDISPKSIAAGTASIMIEKELQRVDKTAMKSLEQKDVLFIFPQASKCNKTMLVLKKPKTESSIRKVFIPKTVARQLEAWKREQERTKEALGDEYTDYNLVLTHGLGSPVEQSRITAMFQALIEKNDLPRVVFHSLRHSSITYKL